MTKKKQKHCSSPVCSSTEVIGNKYGFDHCNVCVITKEADGIYIRTRGEKKIKLRLL